MTAIPQNPSPSQASLAPRVSRITVGRCYSLGNYENLKYEITVDVPEGGDAAVALNQLRAVLAGLRPIQVNPYDLNAARKLLADPEKEGEGYSPETLQSKLEDARETVAGYEAQLARRTAALQRLNALGGSATHTDAKDTGRMGNDHPTASLRL